MEATIRGAYQQVEQPIFTVALIEYENTSQNSVIGERVETQDSHLSLGIWSEQAAWQCAYE